MKKAGGRSQEAGGRGQKDLSSRKEKGVLRRGFGMMTQIIVFGQMIKSQ